MEITKKKALEMAKKAVRDLYEKRWDKKSGNHEWSLSLTSREIEMDVIEALEKAFK